MDFNLVLAGHLFQNETDVSTENSIVGGGRVHSGAGRNHEGL